MKKLIHIVWVVMLVNILALTSFATEVTDLFISNGAQATIGKEMPLVVATIKPETIQNYSVSWNIKYDFGANASLTNGGTSVLTKGQGMLILTATVNAGSGNFTKDFAVCSSTAAEKTHGNLSGSVYGSSYYKSSVTAGYDPSENQIKFSYGSGNSSTLYHLTGYLDGDDYDSYRIVSTPDSVVSGSENYFLVELAPNLPNGTYKTSFCITSSAGTIHEKEISITVSGNSTTTTPQVDKTEPEVDKTEPEVDKTEPEVDKTEPEVDKTEPEVDKTEPEVDKTEPEVDKTEPNTSTSTGSNSLPTIQQGSPLTTLPTSSNTQGMQNYSASSGTVLGNLVETSSGYTRIEKISSENSILIEQYNDDFALTAVSSVAMELDSFVAFHEGEHNYYIMFTKANSSESNSTEVVRVVKYDKYWKRLAATSISNINTVGGVSYADMAESDGNLLIHSRHTMYKASDGYNHQANLRFTIDISSMSLLNQASSVWNTSSGYVSHSFNQLIDVSSDGFVVTADHGDAYPRSMVLFSWKNNNVVTPNPSVAEVLSIYGTIGNNTTKARFGGLQVGTSSVILAGSSVTQNSSFASNTDYNVFVTATPRSNFSTSASTITWITKYDGNTYASNPYLVEITEDKFILMWNELPLADSPVLCWTTIDGSGKQVGSIQRGVGHMSSVEPKVNSQGEIVWYSTKNSAPVFYVLDLSRNAVESVDTSGLVVEETTPDTTPDTTTPDTTTPNSGSSVPLTGASSWATSLITEASTRGLLSDMSDVTSKYQSAITRQEFCRIIINVYESTGKTPPTGNNPFTDTNNADVISAYILGIVNGKSATIFAPNDQITRQELAVMVVRVAELFETITGLSTTASFSDYNSVDSWAKTAVFYAEREGFLAGSNGKILPHDNLTCEQAITVCLRLAQRFTDSANQNTTVTPDSKEDLVAQSFLEQIKSIQSKYGTTGNQDFTAMATGLLSADLVDFNGDGQNELVLSYVSSTEGNVSNFYAYVTTTHAVYSYVNGKVVELFSEEFTVAYGSNYGHGVDYYYLPYQDQILFVSKEEKTHMYNSFSQLDLWTYAGSTTMKRDESLYVGYYSENNVVKYSWKLNGVTSSTTGSDFPEDAFALLWAKVPQYNGNALQEFSKEYTACVAYLQSIV